MNTIATPESSNIKAVGYDSISHELEIDFKSGGKYLYTDVPEKIYESLMHAPSKGKFFHASIKEIYKYSKIK